MSAEVTSTLLPVTSTVATHNPGLGTLITLPREIRDEIYRYFVTQNHWFIKSARKAKWYLVPPTPDFAICFVSKDVHDEASSIFYSESLFGYFLNGPSHTTVTCPIPAFDRIMNIEWDIGLIDDSAVEYRFETLLDWLASPHSLRNKLRISFDLCSPNIPTRFLNHLKNGSKAFVGFRTAVIEAMLCLRAKRDDREPIARTMEKEMAPIMGPATVSFTDCGFRLEYHHLEYMRSTLCAATTVQ